MSVKKRKKLNLRVKKYFQKWILIRILGMIILSSVLAALILYFYARTEVTASFFDAHIKIRRVSDLLLPVVVAGSVVSLISGFVISLFLPQKIAGPIYRIEQDLKLVQEGDLTSLITLRDGDVLTELAEEVNKAIIETSNRVQNSKDALAALVETLGTSVDGNVQDRIRNLQDSLARLKTG